MSSITSSGWLIAALALFSIATAVAASTRTMARQPKPARAHVPEQRPVSSGPEMWRLNRRYAEGRLTDAEYGRARASLLAKLPG